MFNGCHSDRAGLEQLMSAVTVLTSAHEAQELAAAARLEAARLIDEFWPFVQKIAKALNKRGRLSGAEIRGILGLPPRARQNKEPAITTRPADIPPRAPQPKSAPILMARVDGGINLPRDLPPPDPGQCEAVTRAFQRRHSGGYVF
jgi:hypothetical protein